MADPKRVRVPILINYTSGTARLLILNLEKDKDEITNECIGKAITKDSGCDVQDLCVTNARQGAALCTSFFIMCLTEKGPFNKVESEKKLPKTLSVQITRPHVDDLEIKKLKKQKEMAARTTQKKQQQKYIRNMQKTKNYGGRRGCGKGR